MQIVVILLIAAAVFLFVNIAIGWCVATFNPIADFTENYGSLWVAFILALGFLGVLLK